MLNTPQKQLEKSNHEMNPGLQLLVFVGVFIGVLIVGNLAGAGIAIVLYGADTLFQITQLNLAAPNVVNALWIIQIAGTTLPIFIAPVLFALFIARQPEDYLKPSFKFPVLLLLLVFSIMFISSPLIEVLANINQKMILPHFLDGLQQWMKEKEGQTKQMETALFRMDTVWGMIKNLIVVGLFTAIAEEFMFRGVIQTIFSKWTNNVHAAVWITAILFSAFHMEFFGFLPRVLLGVLLGYFVAWSGSIWTSVWAHFINNGTIILVLYFYQNKKTSVNPDDQHLFGNTLYLISLLSVLFLMYVYYIVALNKKQTVQA